MDGFRHPYLVSCFVNIFNCEIFFFLYLNACLLYNEVVFVLNSVTKCVRDTGNVYCAVVAKNHCYINEIPSASKKKKYVGIFNLELWQVLNFVTLSI